MGDHKPFQPDELPALFDPVVVRPVPARALAVSGGSDSTALMVLFAEWLRSCGEDVTTHVVLTVDHGLRPESSEETRAVAARAQAIGFRHAILVWEGPKPASGIQAAARAARYRLLGGYMRANGISLLLTGHTQDDQAETLLMRLARGSGLDGLTGIAPRARWRDLGFSDPQFEDLEVARPLLDVPRSKLRATLKTRGIRWIEDPSNADPDFERPRLRAARDQFEALGLTGEKLAASARRLLRVRKAVERAVDDFCGPASNAVVVDPLGCITVDRERLRRKDEEIALRTLERAVAACGGNPEPGPLGKLEGLAAMLQSTQEGRWTLARAMITATASEITIEREPGRRPAPVLYLSAGEQALWDGRFVVDVGKTAPSEPVEVRACGDELAREVSGRHPSPGRVPLPAAAFVPAFWSSGGLVAVPSLNVWPVPHWRSWIKARFVGDEIMRRGCTRP